MEAIGQELVTIKHDDELRKAFGQRLKKLRKQHKWTQKDLASRLGMRFGQLNKYECGLNAPPLDKLLQLAELLDEAMIAAKLNKSKPSIFRLILIL